MDASPQIAPPAAQRTASMLFAYTIDLLAGMRVHFSQTARIKLNEPARA